MGNNKIILYDNYTKQDEDFYIYDIQAEELCEHLNKLNHEHEYFLIYGTIERWNGKRKGYKLIKNIDSELYSILYDFSKIEYNIENGTIDIITVHHDGTNYYTIKPLSTRGENYYNNHYYEQNDFELLEKIAKTKGLTKKIKINELF